MSIAPGLTTFTRILRALRSVVHVRAKDRSAALVALYTLRPANPFEPTTDEVRMIDAPSGMSGRAFCTVKSVPFTLMSKCRSKCLLGDRAERRALGDAGVREQDVDVTAHLLDRREHAVEVVELRDVALNGRDVRVRSRPRRRRAPPCACR